MGRTASGLTLGLVSLLFLGGCSGCSGTNNTSEQKLSGSGSSFVKPIMDKWIDEYSKAKPGTEINYQSQGSSAGIKQMTEKAVDFGCSDFFLTPDQKEKANGKVVHIPLVMGGVVPAYNLPNIKKDAHLQFRAKVLADIFAGEITNWNDNRIKEANPDVELPNLKISVVHRIEGSGTTAIFTEYLSKAGSKKWGERHGATVDWPVGSGEKGNSAVADAISKNPGSIGYVELLYAEQKKGVIQYGKVANKEGKFVLANKDSVTAAGNSVDDYGDDLCFSLVEKCKGEDVYPISGTTWAVLYKDQSGPRGRALVDFLTWVVHDGQQFAVPMSYVPLPTKLVEKIDAQLKTIKVQ